MENDNNEDDFSDTCGLALNGAHIGPDQQFLDSIEWFLVKLLRNMVLSKCTRS